MIKTILELSNGIRIAAGKDATNAIQNTSIMESCNDGEDISFGSVCSAKIEVKIITPRNTLPINAGDRIIVYEEENGSRRKKGHFIAEKPQNKGANTTNVVAYDYISLLDQDVTEWFNDLDWFPHTAYNMAKLVCEHCGVEFANSSIPNGDFLVNKTKLDTVTGRQIIRWIGEICGCFCIADENGKAIYRWYEENSTPIVASRVEDGIRFLHGGLSYADYEVKKINRVEIVKDTEKNAVSYPASVGEGNVYTIRHNPFLESDDADVLEIARSLYQRLGEISYTPCKVSVMSSFAFRVGDIVKIKDANRTEFFAYIMDKKRNGQKETLESIGNYERNGAPTLYSTSYSATYGKNLKIQNDIAKVEISSEQNKTNITALAKRVSGTEDGISSLAITVGEHSSELESMAKWQNSTGDTLSSIKQAASENEAKIELLVETSDSGANVVKGSVLVEAINDQSTATISANKVNLNGYVTVKSLGEEGSTVIDGSRVQTGIIKSAGFKNDFKMLCDRISTDLSPGDYFVSEKYAGSDYSTWNYIFSTTKTIPKNGYIAYRLVDEKIVSFDSTNNVIEIITPQHVGANGQTDGKTKLRTSLFIHYSEEGTALNLETGEIISKLFYIRPDGVFHLGAGLNGALDVGQGRLGGFLFSPRIDGFATGGFSPIGRRNDTDPDDPLVTMGYGLNMYEDELVFTTAAKEESTYVKFSVSTSKENDVKLPWSSTDDELLIENYIGHKLRVLPKSASLIGSWKATPHTDAGASLSEIITKQDLINLGIITA